MNTPLLELLPQLLELLAFGAGSVGLSVAGLYVERVAFATVESGHVKLGAWLAFVGAMAFYFAYLMSTDKFQPKLAAVRQRLAD